MSIQTTEKWTEDVWEQIVRKVERTSGRIGASFPYASLNGQYNNEAPDWWTNGFWPGLLWLIYRETGDSRLRGLAAEVEDRMDEPLHAFMPLHHDVGFMWSLTSVAQHKLTGEEASLRRALTAASHLAGRYNAKGRFIRAWNGDDRVGWAIIDCLMNLPLLYWASVTTGDPRFRHIAVNHADTVLREFVRDDGSVHHIVCFNPETGERTGAQGGQGYSPDSAWSRGTAWALYGFALSWRYTREQRYKDAADRVARFFLSALPDDGVPPWDFRAPDAERFAARDSSASACAASGLLELAQLTEGDESRWYRDEAVRLLRQLHEGYGAWDDPQEEGLLRMATANYPRKAYVNTPLIYGDFFFAEAVCRQRGRTETFW